MIQEHAFGPYLCELCKGEVPAICWVCGWCTDCCECDPLERADDWDPEWDLSDMEDDRYYWDR